MPVRTTTVPGGVNGGDGRIFAADNPISQSKKRFLAAFFAAGTRRIQAKTAEGDRGGRACFPVHPLVKNHFSQAAVPCNCSRRFFCTTDTSASSGGSGKLIAIIPFVFPSAGIKQGLPTAI